MGADCLKLGVNRQPQGLDRSVNFVTLHLKAREHKRFYQPPGNQRLAAIVLNMFQLEEGTGNVFEMSQANGCLRAIRGNH